MLIKIKIFFKKLFRKIKKLSKTKKILLISCIIMLFIGIGVLIYFCTKSKVVEQSKSEEFIKQEEVIEEPKITIVDINSKTRPFAVMINNHPTARLHHAGLQDAYIIYEIIVEGGMTRYLALFKDTNTEKIGSVRSSRHYFLDYALENDAYYVHWGWSPQAESQIKSMGINNINGLYDSPFFRDKTLGISLEHTGFTKMELLKSSVESKKYRSETNTKLLLNYVSGDVDLKNKEGVEVANNITIKYSNSFVDTYTYDSDKGYYLRFVNGKEHVDDVTKEQYHFKNIITYQVENYYIKGDDKGRQDISNIGEGEGYYITGGYAIKIKWSKASKEAQTKYTYLDGKEIDVSDGNTFIQIQPRNQLLEIKE